MVQAWYMDDSTEDQREEHKTDPPQYVELDNLKKMTGILYWQIDADNYEAEGELEKIRKDRGYSFMDKIACCPDKLPNYEQKIKSFFEEHIHTDEEIRFILEGSGYFDVRDRSDRWIRIEVVKGDLIVLPAGIYHRFTMDTKNYIQAMRLFVGEPVWTPHNRPCDDMPERLDYLKQMEATNA